MASKMSLEGNLEPLLHSIEGAAGGALPPETPDLQAAKTARRSADVIPLLSRLLAETPSALARTNCHESTLSQSFLWGADWGGQTSVHV